MIYKVEYWKRISFGEEEVFTEDIEANSEEEAIQIVNNRKNILRKQTKIVKQWI